MIKSLCSVRLRCKQEEAEQKAAQNPKGTVMLYRCIHVLHTSLSLAFAFVTHHYYYISCRCGDHVLLSGGPLVSRTGLCSQYEVTALHMLGRGPWGLGRRAQGLSLPLQLQVGMCAEK